MDDLTATVDAKITELSPILTQAHTTVGEVSGKVGTVADIAAGIAADPNPGGQLAQTLRDAISGVNDRYQSLREGYAGVRETALSIIDKLQTLDSIIPGLTIPQGPIDALNTFDARLQEFDTKVNDLLTIDPGTGPVNQAAEKISVAASGIDSKLQDVQGAITQVDDRVTQLRTDIANVADTVNLVITLVTVFIVVLLLYLALLHWVLFRHSGESAGRRPPADNGRARSGWPYAPDGGLAGWPCHQAATGGPVPAIGPDGVVYVATRAPSADPTVAGQAEITALDRRGRVVRGWPYLLPLAWRVGGDGTYLTATEGQLPGGVRTLAVADRRLYATATVCDPGWSGTQLLALEPDGSVAE